MSAASRKPSTGRKSKAPTRKGEGAQGKPKASSELRKAAERNVSRAKALETLYRPLQEAAQAELQKTRSGRNLLAQAHAFGKELGDLFKSITSGKTPREAGVQRARERLTKFGQQYGDQFVAARGRHAHLQPSVEAVAQILRPEMAAQRTWVSETSFLRSMLLWPKASPEDIGTVTQGLGGDPPPLVQSCVTPPYDKSDFNLIPAALSPDLPDQGAWGSPENGTAEIGGTALVTPGVPVGVYLASAFVGQDFPVPPGPTSYKTTISYDWWCFGLGYAIFGVAIVNLDLAIVIDKRDGTRETHAREISLLTTPVFSGDVFNHQAEDVRVTIPFTRDGSNGTVRIMVGADGQGTVIAFSGYAGFGAKATVREICLTSVD